MGPSDRDDSRVSSGTDPLAYEARGARGGEGRSGFTLSCAQARLVISGTTFSRAGSPRTTPSPAHSHKEDDRNANEQSHGDR